MEKITLCVEIRRRKKKAHYSYWLHLTNRFASIWLTFRFSPKWHHHCVDATVRLSSPRSTNNSKQQDVVIEKAIFVSNWKSLIANGKYSPKSNWEYYFSNIQLTIEPSSLLRNTMWKCSGGKWIFYTASYLDFNKKKYYREPRKKVRIKRHVYDSPWIAALVENPEWKCDARVMCHAIYIFRFFFIFIVSLRYMYILDLSRFGFALSNLVYNK